MDYSIKITIITTFLLLSSCQAKQRAETGNIGKDTKNKDTTEMVESDTNYHLNINTILGNTKDVFLSEIADSIVYIKLETTEKYLIGEDGVKIRLADSCIFISEHGKPIGMFKYTGEFIRSIGKIGRGPKEIFSDYDFWPDEANKKIYVWGSRNKVMTFDWDGNYMGSLDMKFSFSNFVYLGQSQFSTFSPTQLQNDTTFYRHFVFNKEGMVVSVLPEQKIKSGKSSERINLISSPKLYQSYNGWLLQTWDRDTIYKISKESEFKPFITWDLVKYKMPQSNISGRSNYIIDFNAVESKSYIYFGYSLNKNYSIGLLNKGSGEYTAIGNSHSSFPDKVYRGLRYAGLPNDLDGGPSFWPRFSGYKGKQYTKLLYASDLLYYNFTENVNELKYPAHRDKFLELVSSLNENDNPVLMIVNMK